jgi:hypothetical protein
MTVASTKREIMSDKVEEFRQNAEQCQLLAEQYRCQRAQHFPRLPAESRIFAVGVRKASAAQARSVHTKSC